MKERDIQTAIQLMLGNHPSVAWSYVTSTGTFKGLKGGRPIKIGIPGLPDICGQLTTGEFLGIEVKMPGKKPTEDQLYFIDMINKNGGFAFYCTAVEQALHMLEMLKRDIALHEAIEIPPIQVE